MKMKSLLILSDKIVMTMIMMVIITPWLSAQIHQEEGCVVQREFIYETAPYPSCHASTIEQTTSGTMVAAWFGGSDEGKPDVGIWVSRFVDGKWLPSVEVANGVQDGQTRFPCWNPVLFQPKAGPLILFFKVGPAPDRWWGEMMISDDNGATWKNRTKLPDGGIGPVKNKPVQLENGEILCPSSDEAGNQWLLHLESTADLGQTWKRKPPLHEKTDGEAIQPSLLFHPNGKLQMICRNRDGQGKLLQIWSEDMGKTWGKISETSLPNPCSGTDAVTLADGRHLLVYNHTNRHSSDSQPTGRSMLNLAVSDDGVNWNAVAVLELCPKSEFSYPAIIQTNDGLVHITYTWNRVKIMHVVVDPAKIQVKSIIGGHWPQ